MVGGRGGGICQNLARIRFPPHYVIVSLLRTLSDVRYVWSATTTRVDFLHCRMWERGDQRGRESEEPAVVI